jgi:phthiocerol/phenolphthiocerol synthesis type-I polyketide synthase E
LSETSGGTTGLEVAIVGMSCHFPGAPSLEAFLDNLRRGVESIRFFTEEELRKEGIRPELLANPSHVRAGAVLDGIEQFDASYFGYTPREAELIDPQQRLFLERAVEALERAGCDPDRFDGTIGVYAGLGNSGYASILSGHPGLRGLVDPFQILIANDRDFLATRVAYKLDLRGPAVVVQTACSTSLAAVHVACQALLGGDCDLALAGGVSVRVPHRTGYLYQEEGIASPDGHCRTFDARAQGTVPGNGVGVVVLRRLADALESGDPIQAVIRGSAINNDGAEKLGYTAPRIEGQAQVIRAALATAEVDPATIGYVEAHGTATALGDPIELAALNQAFSSARGESRCAIGSVKSNFGHLDSAAGVAGLIKTALSLRHGQLFPSLHFERPNPKIDFAGGPFHVNTVLRDWPAGGEPRRAGVSSFGMGGTNVHVVLEEAPPAPPVERGEGPQLLVLSARSGSALQAARANLAAHLRDQPGADLADVAFTLAVGRRALPHRDAFVARSTEEAARVLEAGDPQHPPSSHLAEADPPVAFLFTGQGAQRVGMGEGLYAAEATFRRELDACAEGLRPLLGLDLREALYPGPARRAAAEEALRDTALAQPALFALDYALAREWMARGVRPQAMLGHSVGEYVAACLSGVLDLEDALALVAERGRLMASCSPGAMLAVSSSPDQLEALGDPAVELAAVNAPEQCVISGPCETIETWQRRLETQGVACRRLPTSHAFHSAAMDPILAPFRERVARLPLRPPSVPFVSSATGEWISAAQATDPDYWVRQLRIPVRFAAGVAELLREPRRVLLEVGPGDTLAALARRQVPADARVPVVTSLGDRPGVDDQEALLAAAGRLWVAGVGLDWGAFFAGRRPRRVSLPTYPFERRRYWVDPPARSDGTARARPAAGREDAADWLYVPSWRRAAPAPLAGGAGDFLMFADQGGVAAALAERLRAAGAHVALVEAAGGFERRDAARWRIDPMEAGDYRRLLEELAGDGPPPLQLVHLWGVDAPTEAEQGIFSLMLLAQALGAGDRPGVRLAIVTSGAHEVTGSEPLRPANAAALAVGRVIGMEYRSLVARGIDLEVGGPGGPDAGMIGLLHAELVSESTEPLVALRGRHRWLPAVERLRPAAADGGGLRLREGGVYLLTGGLGGIGLVLGEHLARAARARLVLVSRSGLPERSDWGACRARAAKGDATVARIEAVERMEAAGAEVLVARADVADRDQMARVIAETERRFGAIHGVVHAAGLPGAGLVQLRSRAQAKAVLDPKVQGTLVLHELLRDRPLDFLLLCSSLTGTLGAVGQADYAAANAFLDAFAQEASRAGGPPVLSVAWDTWREAGMAVSVELPREPGERRAERLRLGLTNREGVEVFGRALEARLPRLLVSTRALEGRLADRPRGERAAVEAPGPAPGSAPRHPRPVLQNDYVAPRSELERDFAEAWQRVLGIDRVGVTDNFFELGGESLGALRLVGLLKETRGIAISLVRLYESPTIEGLARHLEGAEASPLTSSGRRGEARAEIMGKRRQARRP